MSGPIVRSGASPEFSKNWESVFGKKSKSSDKVAKTPSAASKAPKKKAAKKKAKK